MKSLSLLFLSLALLTGVSLQAQTQDPDQNPNYKNSAEKYALQADALLANQGETVQETYKAYDWTEYKAERRQSRIDRRHELRMERARYNFYPRPYYGFNYGYGYNFYPNNVCSSVLLGAGLYHLLSY